ncbi:TPA: type II toxin-antitoxin system RelE/ParE family toxin [Burkholderia aenigmatica]|uniref:type II toxin-antitoxin system RelE/ParE family toxin n=1 Tax=Burkholderia sp. AU45251 TaxID=3059204 RepID=UPI00264FDC18|nr:type II toxin-antitoxin system RelE/ParE family toxin [Burkholderia sp. AU45251]HDR9484288.1 type II toxin-antitoxin system RelE/ParE family toxin [Burkholderia aenigmatica]MDN7518956.1 type II toxin-antitoxin system RelE/ParE family toxin [Burkholderia sp. AU45251]HDR9516093.1 type II toxin-antitoxin system RelE/ParE family toxin [Burkholderia aenigmatica]HDR9593153.1 type II toxin-antitoxin system RelE/ParE family toxin [Burkholderia aenigmatica]HDR9599357.1 type II toxin-antitoxin system
MTYTVRFTSGASDDLDRLYAFVVDRDDAEVEQAERALAAIASGIATLESSPFTCRKVHPSMPFLRELIIPFGASGYVALFEIDDSRTVTILAVRHQRESDYH